MYIRMYLHVHVQYPSATRYKACKLHKLHAFARGDKHTCTLRQIHVYTWLNGFIQGDKRVYTRRQAHLPYTLYLMGTVHQCISVFAIHRVISFSTVHLISTVHVYHILLSYFL